MTPTTLEAAVKELTAYNMHHPLDLVAHVEEVRPPGPNYYRVILIGDEVYRVCLTRMFMAKTWLWMLSVMKPGAPANASGAHLPTQAETEKIASAFFPQGFTALDEGSQIITMTCRKAIATEVANE